MTVASPAGLVGTAGTINNNGQAQINGVLRIDQNGFPGGGSGTYAYDQTNGTLAFNNTSGAYGVNNNNFWPTVNSPQNVSVGSGGIQMNVARTIGLTFQTSGGTFGAGNLTFNGLCTIFNGGFFSGSPNYGANSTLVYSTGGNYGRAGEWLPGATSGAGYPANVQLSNNTTLDLPNGSPNSPFEMSGSLTVDSNSKLQLAGAPPLTQPLTVKGNVTLSGNLELSTAIGGDLKVGGNLATSNPGLTANNRAVFFNGSTPQTVGSAPLFDYVVVQNTAGVNSNGGIISVNKDFSVAPGASFTGTIGGGSGSLIMQPGSTFTNSGTITADLLVNRSALNLSGVNINTVLQMHPGSTASGAGPTYAASSTLLYIAGGTYNRGAEWSATSGAGYPANVRLQGASTLEVGANGGAGTARQISGSLQVENGSLFQMDGATPMTASVTALGGIFNNGTITLSTLAGGDLRTGGDLNNAYLNPAAPGTINGNGRRLHFVGGAMQNILNGSVASITLPSLVVDKTGGILQPSVDVFVNPSAAGEGISFLTATSGLSLLGKTLTLGGGTFSSDAGGGFLSSPSPAGSLVVNGSGDAGTLPAAGQNFNQLTVNRTGAGGNVTLDGSVHIVSTLTLTEGTITTGAANTLQLGEAASVARTNGSVVGNLKKLFGGAGSFTFPSSTEAGYAPVDAQVTAGAGSLTVSGTDGKLPAVTGANALTRYWTLAGSGITANLTFHYNAADVSVTPPATEASYSLIKNGSGVLQVAPNSSTNASTHTATATGVNTFSDWTLAEPASVFGSLQFDAPSYSVGESGATVTLNVTRTGGSGGAIGTSYTTVDGSATAGNDYTTNSGTLSWADGDTASKPVTVAILDDSNVEGDEAFNVNLNSPTGGAVLGTPGDVSVTITDDDTAPTPPNVVYVDDDFANPTPGQDPDGAGSATNFGYDAFSTVQGGIDGVAVGGTVNVAPGDYAEQPVINKDLTLAGAGVNASNILAPASLAPRFNNFRILVEVNNGAEVEASGITVKGPLNLGGCPNVVGASPVRYYGVYVRGGATLNFHHSSVIDIRENNPAANTRCTFGTAVNVGSSASSQSGTLTLDHTTITGFQARAVTVDNTGSSATITNNTLTGSTSPSFVQTVILVALGATANISDNQITGAQCNDALNCGNDTFNQPAAVGISLTGAGGGTQITNNNISNNDYGINFVSFPGDDADISGNTFDANRYFGINITEGHVNITGNVFSGASEVAVVAASVNDPANQTASNSSGTLTGNTITGATTALQLLDQTNFPADNFVPQLTAHFNRIVATTTAIDNPQNRTSDMENNWWGCNAGAGNTGCGASEGTGADFSPWFVLAASATPDTIVPGGTSDVLADMTHNSDGATPATSLPDIPVSFPATNGTMSPPTCTITSGTTTAIFTSTNASNGVAGVVVDNQTVNVPITVNAPAFSIDDVEHSEGDSDATDYTFTVTKTGATNLDASVDYATVDGTAISPSDFTALSTGTLIFQPAETTKQVTVTVNGDTDFESDEAFTVHLSNATGANISDADGTATITNDDTRPTPSVVYVDDDWASLPNGTDPDGAGPATNFGYDAFSTVQGGIDGVANPGTVNVAAGTYLEDVNLNKSVALIGTAGASTTNLVGKIGGSSATVSVAASNVTVAGFTITREGNNTTDWNNAGLNSVGIAIQGQAITGALIRDNIITGNRTGLDFNNTNGHTVRNNIIDFNRTGFIYRNQTDNQTVLENFVTNNWTVGILFLDASGGTNSPVQSALHSTFSNNNISGNWYGQIADRQSGGSLPTPGTTNLKNFRGNWFGTTTPIVTTTNTAEPGYAAQIPVAYGGSATPPGGQPDIAGPASANFKYTPLLPSGTDTNVETAPGRGTFGFQGVQAANVVVIRENNLRGWTQAHSHCNGGTSTGSQSFVPGPGTPPAGAGSLRYQIGSDGDSFETIRNPDYHDTLLSALTALSYSTYVTQDGSGGQAAYLLLNIDFNNDSTVDDQIFFEPVYQSAAYFPANPQGALTTGEWQTWDALHGGWWSVNGIAGATPGTGVKSLAAYFAAQPTARIINSSTGVGGFRIATGCGAGAWDNFDGNADNLLVGVSGANTTYDLEPQPRISIDDVEHTEGDSGTTDYTFNVTLDAASDQTVTVDYATADDTATSADNDYNAVATTQLSFAPGEISKQLTVTVNGDTVFESDEQFFVNLTNPVNATLLDAQGAGTITNDDAAPTGDIQFTSPTYTASESGATAHVSVARVNGSSGTVSAIFNTSDGTATAGNDYTAVTNYSVTYNDGETGTKTIDIPISPDTLFEGDETINLTLSATTVGSVRSVTSGLSATLTITDDDAAPAISINDAFVSEPEASGTSDATFTVSLSNASSTSVTVDYATADDTATAPGDYNAVNTTTLTFDPGQTSKTVTVTVNFDAQTEGNETFSVNLSNSSGASIADATGTGTITDPAQAAQVLISEFRFHGATYNAGGGVDGSYDEYIELYNNTSSPITVSTTDGSGGWTVAALSSDGASIVPLATIPAGTLIPARAHYLVANSDTPTNPATGGYSLTAYAAPDKLYTPDIADNAGVALFRTSNSSNFNLGNRFDAVGFAGLSGATADLFREGAGLVSPGANDGQYAFVRKLTSGLPADTDANAADFTFVSTDGGAYGGVQSILGAPGPENKPASPVQRNAVVKASLIEPTVASTASPNRVRSGRLEPGVPNAFGTLSIQRRFKNATNDPITRLRFRVVDITTLNTPLASAPQADMRVLSSTGEVINSAGDTVATVTGLTLEEPPAQANGGGLNSTLTVALPGNMLAPGSSIDVQFLLGVQQQGNFRFLVNVEALPGLPVTPAAPDGSNLRNRDLKATGGGKQPPQER
jgi:hypothetical protein